jgi:phage shock protein PspC (stress-responsive transcriptional regulator)
VTELRIAAALFGAGMGLTNNALLIAVQTSVPFERRGVATASITFFRSVGGTVGVAIMGVIVARDLLSSVVARDAGGEDLIARLLTRGRRDTSVSVLAGIAEQLQLGIRHVLWFCTVIAFVAVLLSWILPSAPARDKER